MSATARPRSSRVTRACDHSLLATGVEQVEKTAMSSEYTVDAIWPIMALFGLEEELVDLRASKGAEELVSDMAVPVVVPRRGVSRRYSNGRSVGRLVGRSVGTKAKEGKKQIPHAGAVRGLVGIALLRRRGSLFSSSPVRVECPPNRVVGRQGGVLKVLPQVPL